MKFTKQIYMQHMLYMCIYCINYTVDYNKNNRIIDISLAALEHVAEIDVEIFSASPQMLENSRMTEILYLKLLCEANVKIFIPKS